MTVAEVGITSDGFAYSYQGPPGAKRVILCLGSNDKGDSSEALASLRQRLNGRVIWILPAQNVSPQREPGSTRIIDYYEYRNGHNVSRYRPDEIVHFRYPDPRDPYTAGLSPLRACWEQANEFPVHRFQWRWQFLTLPADRARRDSCHHCS